MSSKHLPGKIILQGENNLEVTPAIRAYVEEKLAKAVANADPRDVREIDCRVASRGGADHATKGAHVCTTKATVLTRAGQIEVVEEHEDLYASIDKVADGLKRQLRKFTEKREGNARGKKEEILMAAGVARRRRGRGTAGGLIEHLLILIKGVVHNKAFLILP